jgi:hypothetical protein
MGHCQITIYVVYHEVFETILFYQSLIIQTQPTQQFSILLGLL